MQISNTDKTLILKNANTSKKPQEVITKLSDRLKALLDGEEKQYELEFMANLETPEQVREKMAQRLVELKNKREDER